MNTFADHLFEDLMAEHGAVLAAAAAPGSAPAEARARHRYARPAWAGVGAAAAGAAAAVGFTVFGGTASAYAVTDNHNGSVTVKVRKAEGLAGLNTTLHKMGIGVMALKATPGCPPIESFASRVQLSGMTSVTVHPDPDGDNTITVQSKGLPKNVTMLVAFSFDTPMQRIGSVLVNGPVPDCVSLGPGAAGWRAG